MTEPVPPLSSTLFVWVLFQRDVIHKWLRLWFSYFLYYGSLSEVFDLTAFSKRIVQSIFEFYGPDCTQKSTQLTIQHPLWKFFFRYYHFRTSVWSFYMIDFIENYFIQINIAFQILVPFFTIRGPIRISGSIGLINKGFFSFTLFFV